ncbi:methyltransferase domain-containing protein [Muricauda sp. JGD-17]|uniref:Methyltransferase domain-containing protein n=1 Tax=Flagellimonas ochracea TaxID=2696472 RepID=A0A964TC59_9FLAO|nr:class I SAM-dependent methyltransferase [Allomuricauda ochracea]NAY91323.1 methyltransferase domain-containing protein [Allomuricauda ochracea]
MASIETFNEHVAQYEQWYEDHPAVYQSEILALQEQFLELPQNIRGIEVGLGTGRFSVPLGIKEGIEPSSEMAKRAMKRGIEIMSGTAERLPYSAMQFDFVLFVTVCHLKSLKKALKEAHRVLKSDGSVIVGFLDKEQHIAQSYLAKRDQSNFYKNAVFYSVDRIEQLLMETGFKNLKYNQTLFGDLKEINEIQIPKDGTGEGSFVVVKALKK